MNKTAWSISSLMRRKATIFPFFYIFVWFTFLVWQNLVLFDVLIKYTGRNALCGPKKFGIDWTHAIKFLWFVFLMLNSVKCTRLSIFYCNSVMFTVFSSPDLKFQMNFLLPFVFLAIWQLSFWPSDSLLTFTFSTSSKEPHHQFHKNLRQRILG